MVAIQAIETADRLRPNSIPKEDKVQWLHNFETRRYNEVYSLHKEHPKQFTTLYNFSQSTQLFMNEPYNEAYVLYLCSMIDFFNAEYDRYNNDVLLLESLYSDYKKYYNSRYKSLQDTLITG